MSDKENPMLHRVAGWARPRRWSILSEAVLAAALALVALPIAAEDEASAEVELVTDYLEALRDGDVEEAKSYIGPGRNPEADGSWLTEEALSSDWEIESVRQRSATDVYVHAVISSGGQTAESVFYLEATEDGPRIINPYMYVAVGSGPLRTLELNGEWHLPRGLRENTTAQVALFPGSYRLFEDVPGFEGGRAVSFLAMPRSLPVELARLAGDTIAGNRELEAQLNEDLAAWIDSCAQSTEAAPEDCPFSAGTLHEEGRVDDGAQQFEEVRDLAWAVDAYPHVRIHSGLWLETVAPGWMTVSGSGVTVAEGTVEAFRGRCKIIMDSIEVTLLAGGRFEFTYTGNLDTTCRQATS